MRTGMRRKRHTSPSLRLLNRTIQVVDQECKQCKKTFEADASEVRKGGAKFCGRPCYNESRRKK